MCLVLPKHYLSYQNNKRYTIYVSRFLSSDDVVKEFSNMTISMEECDSIEIKTPGHAGNSIWNLQRKGRITRGVTKTRNGKRNGKWNGMENGIKRKIRMLV